MRNKLLPIILPILLLVGGGMLEQLNAQCTTAPSGLSSTAVSATSSNLSWTTGGASHWNVEYGPYGFLPGNGTHLNTTSPSTSLTNLSQNVYYQFYVRDSCGPASLSSWSGPQTVFIDTIPCEDMENYSTGLVQNQSILLLPWAGNGGDGTISTDYASSGNNSLKIYDSGPNAFSDIVGVVNEPYTSGIHNVKFDFYIPEDFGGYYNILHNYTGATNVWAIEVYLDSNGTATVEEGTNGSLDIGTYEFNLGAWNTVEHIINLDDDTAFIKVNGVCTDVGWQFSLGSTNFGDQFNAVNFYSAANPNQTPLMYFDDFCISDAEPMNDVGVVEMISPTPLCGDSNFPVEVVVQNYGVNSLSFFTLDVDITGSLNTNLGMNYTNTLNACRRDTVLLGTINNVVGGTYDIEAYTSLFSDTVPANDSANYNGVVVFESPSIYLGPDIAYCSNTNFSEVLMSGAGVNDSVWWNSNDTTASITITTAGNYVAAVTNSFGCIDRDTIVVLEFDPANVDLGPDLGYCAGESPSFTLDAGSFANASYLWSVTSTTQMITTSFPGVYSVTVTTNEVCHASDTIQITEYPIPVVDMPDQQICGGDSATFDAGNAGATFVWNIAGETGQTVTTATAGIYAVTVTNAGGCVGTDSAELEVNFAPIVDLGEDTTIYQPNFLTLDAGNPGATYLWNTSATTQTINVATTGTYTVTVTSPEGCDATDEIEVEVLVGIEDVNGEALTFYPNPTQGMLNIAMNVHSNKSVQFDLFDLNGTLIRSMQRNPKANSVESFDLTDLPSGIYYMNVSANDTRLATLKVTKI